MPARSGRDSKGRNPANNTLAGRRCPQVDGHTFPGTPGHFFDTGDWVCGQIALVLVFEKMWQQVTDVPGNDFIAFVSKHSF